jgi:hypothetical protein
VANFDGGYTRQDHEEQFGGHGMDNGLLTALVGAAGAVAAAVFGALAGRSEFTDRLFLKRRFPSLAGTRWSSTWIDVVDGKNVNREEIFEFAQQKRGRVFGEITMNHLPDLKWRIEGDYNDRFLRLFWQPSPDATNKFFMDYGCYFFERKGTGHFEGVAVGFDWQTNKIETTDHQLKQLAK